MCPCFDHEMRTTKGGYLTVRRLVSKPPAVTNRHQPKPDCQWTSIVRCMVDSETARERYAARYHWQ